MAHNAHSTVVMIRHEGSSRGLVPGQAAEVMSAFIEGRFPHPPGWELPCWVQDAFVVNDMGAGCEQAQDWPFLRQGVVPKPGQRLYLNIHYADVRGDHPHTYNGWARMVGHVTEVLPPPPIGLYATYSGQQPEVSREEQLSRGLPVLPPSYEQHCTCGRAHPLHEVLLRNGAVHGQRVRGRMRLSCDDEGLLGTLLEGVWDIELIMNDHMEKPWVVCKMVHAGPAERPLAEAYPPGPGSEPCWIRQPDGSMKAEYPVHPLRRHECAACGAVGAVMRGREGTEVLPLKVCRGCHQVYFCNEECQRAFWPQHREACRAAQVQGS